MSDHTHRWGETRVARLAGAPEYAVLREVCTAPGCAWRRDRLLQTADAPAWLSVPGGPRPALTAAEMAVMEQGWTDSEPYISQAERTYRDDARRLLAEVRRLQAAPGRCPTCDGPYWCPCQRAGAGPLAPVSTMS